ncbi:hypothetical protein L9F63_003965, partial [Diploptera punctata]
STSWSFSLFCRSLFSLSLFYVTFHVRISFIFSRLSGIPSKKVCDIDVLMLKLGEFSHIHGCSTASIL